MGKLFLASDGFGKHKDVLLSWLPRSPKVALILNAADYKEVGGRAQRKVEEIDSLNEAGLTDIEEIDLRDFHDSQMLLQKLSQFDLVWIRGGNTFYLRWIMHESGFDKAIKELLDEEKVVYGGYSAGAIVMSAGLWGIEEMDSPEDAEVAIYEGLGYIKPVIVPHYKSDRWAEAADKAIEILKEQKREYIALTDRMVVIVENGSWQVLD